MKDLIEKIKEQVTEAISIGEGLNHTPAANEINKILLCGLGGSGIGGAIVSQLLKKELKVPFVCVNDYNVPAFVDQNTLIIASSYSGNTEETIAAVEEGKGRGDLCYNFWRKAKRDGGKAQLEYSSGAWWRATKSNVGLFNYSTASAPS